MEENQEQEEVFYIKRGSFPSRPKQNIHPRLDECYLRFNNWRPPWGWKRFSLFISKISRFSRASNNGELKREYAYREPIPFRRKLKGPVHLAAKINLAAKIRLAAKIYFAVTIPSTKEGRKPSSVCITPLKEIFLE
ncbi:unnamed protein product [Microthlaspi erraticum]|uniref:Uncharacterized protein n=1 Tax=Microthlaspi erraticum TaxID=1685480 RepID=A0A6D2I240_9BRAS|nr:unnamed protein product [Microthlaspi erraticum]